MNTVSYACYNKNPEILKSSSSGGIWYLLANEVIKEGGIIYGACYDKTDVKHCRITDYEDVVRTCGSKYVPSDIKDIFGMVRIDLQNDKLVLFSGTPCQCVGLKSFIGNNEKLICVDFVCHGIPSSRAWSVYKKSLAKEGFTLSSVNMRDKRTGWMNYSCSLKSEDGKQRTELHKDNFYLRGFNESMYLRPSCYECRFKGIERVTDITLSDFWGIDDIQPEMANSHGTSLVLIHTERGMSLFDAIKDKVVYVNADFNKAAKKNKYMIYSAKRPDKRDVFFARLNAGENFEVIMKDILNISRTSQIKQKLRQIIASISFGRGGGYLTSSHIKIEPSSFRQGYLVKVGCN